MLTGLHYFCTHRTKLIYCRYLLLGKSSSSLTNGGGPCAAVNAVQIVGSEMVSASGDRSIKIWSLETSLSAYHGRSSTRNKSYEFRKTLSLVAAVQDDTHCGLAIFSLRLAEQILQGYTDFPIFCLFKWRGVGFLPTLGSNGNADIRQIYKSKAFNKLTLVQFNKIKYLLHLIVCLRLELTLLPFLSRFLNNRF